MLFLTAGSCDVSSSLVSAAMQSLASISFCRHSFPAQCSKQLAVDHQLAGVGEGYDNVRDGGIVT